MWPKVREFVMALPPGALVADVGCGNGKYFGLRSDIFVLGTDRSTGGRICVDCWGLFRPVLLFLMLYRSVLREDEPFLLNMDT